MNKLVVTTAVFMSLASQCFAENNQVLKKESIDRKDSTKQQLSTEMKRNSEKVPISRFSLDMLEQGRIDLRFRGLPIDKVVAAIEKVTGFKKGEFETTDEFNARKSDAIKSKVLGDLGVDDIYAFVIPVQKVDIVGVGGQVGYKYDADTGVVNLYAFPKSSKYSPMNGIGAPDYHTNRRESMGLDQFSLSHKVHSKSTYQGSNAYGAKVTVEKVVSTDLGIAANKIPFLKLERNIVYNNLKPAAQFNIERSRASVELPAMKALIVIKLSDPYIVYDFFRAEPTRDSPKDMSVQGKYLTGDVLGIAYFSGLTGEIFVKLPQPSSTYISAKEAERMVEITTPANGFRILPEKEWRYLIGDDLTSRTKMEERIQKLIKLTKLYRDNNNESKYLLTSMELCLITESYYDSLPPSIDQHRVKQMNDANECIVALKTKGLTEDIIKYNTAILKNIFEEIKQ